YYSKLFMVLKGFAYYLTYFKNMYTYKKSGNLIDNGTQKEKIQYNYSVMKNGLIEVRLTLWT
ncbi:MAG: hypothetical protein DRP55_04485, partial [Spirochaetes bacterium]